MEGGDELRNLLVRIPSKSTPTLSGGSKPKDVQGHKIAPRVGNRDTHINPGDSREKERECQCVFFGGGVGKVLAREGAAAYGRWQGTRCSAPWPRASGPAIDAAEEYWLSFLLLGEIRMIQLN